MEHFFELAFQVVIGLIEHGLEEMVSNLSGKKENRKRFTEKWVTR